MRSDVIEAAAKNVPPATVGLLTWAGFTVEEWVQILTIVWMLILIGGKVYDFVKWIRARRATK